MKLLAITVSVCRAPLHHYDKYCKYVYQLYWLHYTTIAWLSLHYCCCCFCLLLSLSAAVLPINLFDVVFVCITLGWSKW